MNKENGIKRLNRLSVKAKEYRDENTQVVKLSQAIEVIELIDQVGEPERVVVPPFVADWYERRDCRNLDSAITYECSILNQLTESEMSKFDKWFESEKNPIETIIKMKLYGYVVEETLYYMPLPYQSNNTIYYYKQDDGKISFKQGGMMKDHSKFTQEELDKYFPEIKHMAIEVGDE